MEPSEYSAGRNSPDKVNQDLPHQISNPHSSSSPLRKRSRSPTKSKSPSWFDADLGSGKHHPPLLGSEVWRLEGIPENGVEASRLAEEGILTVKDLRRCIARDPDALHGILGRCVSKKTLERIVSHAMDCYFDDEVEFYAYDAQAEGVFLLFNSVYNLVQVSFDGVTSLRSELLTSNQKELTHKLKHEAYENVDRFVPVYRAGFVDQDPPLWESNYVEPDFSASGSECSSYTSGSESSQEDSSEIFPPDPSRVSSDKYDVIIRYNKRDISNGFISHLLAALCQKGISASGASIFKRPDGVPECRVVITFLTHRCVSYNLLEFCDRLPSKELGVSQIFYRVSPSNLISNTKKLERFLLQHQKSIWWNVLQQVAQMSDYILTDKSDPELMHEIVKDVSKVLLSSDKEKMIGIDSQVEEILSLLGIESPDVRSIGLWGTAGIGKTAIAEKIFRRISVQYKTCVFFKDLHEEVEEKGQVTVAEEFLSKLLEVEPPVLKISDINTCFLRSRLQCKKILVILDDVHDFKDVQTFLGNLNYFGPGSRVIITSRNRRVFVQSKIDHIYEVKPLDIPTALLLLLESGKLKSFKSKLTDDFRKQSLELVKFANGNPEVLQYMRSRPQEEWDLLSQEVLQSSPICIPRILRSCYGLDENEINILLDIACFFRRMDKDDVALLLDGCGFFAQVGFRSLVDKSLLTIPHNTVDMHRYIQATGREIVRQESPNEPGKRSRLWNAEEVVDVFLNDSGTSAIEGIFLDMSKKVFDGNPNTFEKMCNLRLLKFYCSEVIKKSGVSLRQGLEYLPNKLRLLHWEYYPLSALPRSFDPKNLVELNLPNSCANQLWKGKKSLEKLRKMRLSYSYQLTKIPRLSNAPNLEHIDLEGCSSLASISQSISSLKKLVFLNLKDCSKLESVPSTVDLESLEVLNISGCSKLETLPEISPNVKELFMGATMIQEIPSSIKNLVSLEKLDLENSRHLVNLPTSICKLKHLETLNLSGCSSLERFPELSRRMKCLKSLDLSRTAVKVLHSSISYMVALEELRFVECKNLVRLPDNAWSLRFKVEFRQIDAEKFSKLWNRFGWLKKAQDKECLTLSNVHELRRYI
uniref:Putative WRKY transcription factor 19 n=1 Tax=Noccaea caerulescens TaxID=107243 RepID=A0A1J3DZN0_NOCCA